MGPATSHTVAAVCGVIIGALAVASVDRREPVAAPTMPSAAPVEDPSKWGSTIAIKALQERMDRMDKEIDNIQEWRMKHADALRSGGLLPPIGSAKPERPPYDPADSPAYRADDPSQQEGGRFTGSPRKKP